jgi:hypothetical protein
MTQVRDKDTWDHRSQNSVSRQAASASLEMLCEADNWSPQRPTESETLRMGQAACVTQALEVILMCYNDSHQDPWLGRDLTMEVEKRAQIPIVF